METRNRSNGEVFFRLARSFGKKSSGKTGSTFIFWPWLTFRGSRPCPLLRPPIFEKNTRVLPCFFNLKVSFSPYKCSKVLIPDKRRNKFESDSITTSSIQVWRHWLRNTCMTVWLILIWFITYESLFSWHGAAAHGVEFAQNKLYGLVAAGSFMIHRKVWRH